LVTVSASASVQATDIAIRPSIMARRKMGMGDPLAWGIGESCRKLLALTAAGTALKAPDRYRRRQPRADS
jgi:hypothetical protein